MKLKLVVLGCAALLLAAVGWLYFQHGKPAPTLKQTSQSVKILVPHIAQADEYKIQLRDYFQSIGKQTEFTNDSNQAELIISTTAGTTAEPIQQQSAGSPVKLNSGTLIQPDHQSALYLSAATSNIAGQPAGVLLKTLAQRLQAGNSDKTWSLQAVGDIILGRLVYQRMLQFGITSPFAKTASQLKSSDLTLADLEVTLADGIPHSTDLATLNFSAPSKAISGLKLAGIDGVNLANNHSYNGGSQAFVQMMDSLRAAGIQYYGAGKNYAQAHQPAAFNVKGTKIALLGYSSIIGTHEAGANDPGQAYLSMPPWGKWDEARVVQMEKDIKAAKARADVVMVYYHWGVEYTHAAIAEQRQVAHRAIDAGADLILGTHPHWVQGIEWYHHRLITYSLGNFIFDQKWPETQQGTLLQAQFAGPHLLSAKLVPYQIANYYQPYFVSGASAQAILHDVYSHSWWPQ